MSMTRIRYKKTGTNNFASVGFFPSVQGPLQVVLASNVFNLVNTENGQVVASGEASSLAGLKKQAKQKLSDLGVVFSNESRNREDKNLKVDLVQSSSLSVNI